MILIPEFAHQQRHEARLTNAFKESHGRSPDPDEAAQITADANVLAGVDYRLSVAKRDAAEAAKLAAEAVADAVAAAKFGAGHQRFLAMLAAAEAAKLKAKATAIASAEVEAEAEAIYRHYAAKHAAAAEAARAARAEAEAVRPEPGL